MKLSNESIKDTSFWKKADIALPRFDRPAMIAATKAAPQWIHFGAGNIFRAFPASLAQQLLEQGLMNTGIVVAEGYDGEIIDKCFAPYDNLSLLVTLKSDGTTEKQIIGSVAFSYRMDKDFDKLRAIFASPSLQMASFTITEKGYALTGRDGSILPDIASDLANGPSGDGMSVNCPRSYLGSIAALLFERYAKGAFPIAFVSMDNCSHNGDILYAAMETIARGWVENSLADAGFLNYVRDKGKVSFPWTMIDKITPRPDESVRDMLDSLGIEDVQGTVTQKNTYIAPFVNAEETQYLVIEDVFPNGRPPLEKTGVLFADKKTVDRIEKMKVCTCLNPLHTALAVFGCLLGYTRISEEMKDESLVKLIKGIGYNEGLPVVVDPGIINPKDFIDKVIQVRLPNPFMPDAPQRIAMDSSLKIPIRFGETIKAYIKSGKDTGELKLIPFVFAGWLRYLLGIDDKGAAFEVSPDPNYHSLAARLAGIQLGQSGPFTDKLKPILSNPEYFGVNLYETGSTAQNSIGARVEKHFAELIAGPGAVRKTLARMV